MKQLHTAGKSFDIENVHPKMLKWIRATFREVKLQMYKQCLQEKKSGHGKPAKSSFFVTQEKRTTPDFRHAAHHYMQLRWKTNRTRARKKSEASQKK